MKSKKGLNRTVSGKATKPLPVATASDIDEGHSGDNFPLGITAHSFDKGTSLPQEGILIDSEFPEAVVAPSTLEPSEGHIDVIDDDDHHLEATLHEETHLPEALSPGSGARIGSGESQSFLATPVEAPSVVDLYSDIEIEAPILFHVVCGNEIGEEFLVHADCAIGPMMAFIKRRLTEDSVIPEPSTLELFNKDGQRLGIHKATVLDRGTAFVKHRDVYFPMYFVPDLPQKEPEPVLLKEESSSEGSGESCTSLEMAMEAEKGINPLVVDVEQDRQRLKELGLENGDPQAPPNSSHLSKFEEYPGEGGPENANFTPKSQLRSLTKSDNGEYPGESGPPFPTPADKKKVSGKGSKSEGRKSHKKHHESKKSLKGAASSKATDVGGKGTQGGPRDQDAKSTKSKDKKGRKAARDKTSLDTDNILSSALDHHPSPVDGKDEQTPDTNPAQDNSGLESEYPGEGGSQNFTRGPQLQSLTKTDSHKEGEYPGESSFHPSPVVKDVADKKKTPSKNGKSEGRTSHKKHHESKKSLKGSTSSKATDTEEKGTQGGAWEQDDKSSTPKDKKSRKTARDLSSLDTDNILSSALSLHPRPVDEEGEQTAAELLSQTSKRKSRGKSGSGPKFKVFEDEPEIQYYPLFASTFKECIKICKWVSDIHDEIDKGVKDMEQMINAKIAAQLESNTSSELFITESGVINMSSLQFDDTAPLTIMPRRSGVLSNHSTFLERLPETKTIPIPPTKVEPKVIKPKVVKPKVKPGKAVWTSW